MEKNMEKLDQFYTKPDIARQCVSFFEKATNIDLSKIQVDIIEPSAGSGNFLKFLPLSTLSYDKEPHHPFIIKQDYLTLDRQDNAIVIGNPPFGKNSSLAIKFFNHSAKFASHIAFIVPKTFCKSSVQDRLNFQFHLLDSLDIDEDSFLFEEKSYRVPCIFQVWIKKETQRSSHKLPLHHDDFLFCSKEDADFSIQRVGVNAGKIKTDLNHLSSQSHLFIRAKERKDVLSIFKALDFSKVKYNTAGNPSISKREIVDLYTKKKRPD